MDDTKRNKKKLYMIGNSHIDPVWFWDWDEGMQEVKATFSSVLDRMREYPKMRFTSTSSAFFEWIEAIAPKMFEEIRERVAQGRWELAGAGLLSRTASFPAERHLSGRGFTDSAILKKSSDKSAKQVPMWTASGTIQHCRRF